MIDIITKIKYKELDITLFGKIDEETSSIELNCLMQNIVDKEFCDSLIYSRPINIPVLDTKAKSYVLYNCKFTNSTMSFSNAGVMTIRGVFTRLIKETEIDKKYNAVIFGFEGIEKFFPLEKFTTEFESETENFKFVKERSEHKQYNISDTIICEIVSDYEGLIRSNSLYAPCVKQEKVIKLTFGSKISVDEIITSVLKVKNYFEFLSSQELKFTKIVFKNENPTEIHDGYLICDPILLPKTIIKPLKEKPYHESIDTLFEGLKGWYQNYYPYREVLDIWKKTIYNLNVSKMDIFIWYCQAFELLCTLNSDILDKANLLKQANQSYPNLRNFMCATSDLFDICKGLSRDYFKAVKDVRDKLTHNNPNKIVSEDQKSNSLQLIELFFIKTIQNTFGIVGIPTSMVLKENK